MAPRAPAAGADSEKYPPIRVEIAISVTDPFRIDDDFQVGTAFLSLYDDAFYGHFFSIREAIHVVGSGGVSVMEQKTDGKEEQDDWQG